jgi:hypothetical protein
MEVRWEKKQKERKVKTGKQEMYRENGIMRIK